MAFRYYYRCNDCLATSTLTEYRGDLRCVCGGHIRCLGPVTDKGRWLRTELRPECDDRCLSARGRNCNCKCHGKNHGAGLAGVVEVTFDGGAAVLRPLKPEESIRRAEEYRQAKAEVKKALAETYGRDWEIYRTGGFVHNKDVWWSIKTWLEEYYHAKSLLTHKNRIKKLNELAEQIRMVRKAQPV